MEKNIDGQRQITDAAENESFIRHLGDKRDGHLRDEEVDDRAYPARLDAFVLTLILRRKKLACVQVEFARAVEDAPGSPLVLVNDLADDAEIDALIFYLGRDLPLKLTVDSAAYLARQDRKLP